MHRRSFLLLAVSACATPPPAKTAAVPPWEPIDKRFDG